MNEGKSHAHQKIKSRLTDHQVNEKVLSLVLVQ